MRKVTIFVTLLLCSAAPALAGMLGEDWTQREIRGQIELGEVVWPFFGEKGSVGGGAKLVIGLGWRALDPAEKDEDPDADGLKPIGVFGGMSFDITDPFNQNWVQLTAGVTIEEVVSFGMAGWVGNNTETEYGDNGEEMTFAVPGLDFKLKTVFGLGLDAEP